MDNRDLMPTGLPVPGPSQEVALELAWLRGRQRVTAALLAHTAHDLRGPLHSLLGYAQLVGRSDASLAREDALDAIRDAGRCLSQVVHGLLDLGCDMPVADDVAPVAVEWEEFCQGMEREAQALAGSAGIELVSQRSGVTPYRLLCDGRRMRALQRLLLTAICHVDAPQRVQWELQLQAAPNGVRLIMQLSGGSPCLPALLDGVLAEPWQAAQSWLRVSGGDLHWSEERGGRLQFIACLAGVAVADAPTVQVDRYGAGYRGRRRTVLVVDDEIGSRLVLEELLGSSGFRVLAAADGMQAIGMLGDGVDLVITDMSMEGADGHSVLRAVRERLPSCPVLLLSGNSLEPSAVSEFSAVLAKPADFGPLLEVCARLLELEWVVGDVDTAPYELPVALWQRLSELVKLGLVTDILDIGLELRVDAIDERARLLADGIVDAAGRLDFASLQALLAEVRPVH